MSINQSRMLILPHTTEMLIKHSNFLYDCIRQLYPYITTAKCDKSEKKLSLVWWHISAKIFFDLCIWKSFLQIHFLLCIWQMKNVYAILFFIFKIILAYSRQNDFSLLHLRNEKRFVKSSDWHKPAKVSLFYCTVA